MMILYFSKAINDQKMLTPTLSLDDLWIFFPFLSVLEKQEKQLAYHLKLGFKIVSFQQFFWK